MRRHWRRFTPGLSPPSAGGYFAGVSTAMSLFCRVFPSEAGRFFYRILSLYMPRRPLFFPAKWRGQVIIALSYWLISFWLAGLISWDQFPIHIFCRWEQKPTTHPTSSIPELSLFWPIHGTTAGRMWPWISFLTGKINPSKWTAAERCAAGSSRVCRGCEFRPFGVW